jgi:hypothetical protein
MPLICPVQMGITVPDTVIAGSELVETESRKIL